MQSLFGIHGGGDLQEVRMAADGVGSSNGRPGNGQEGEPPTTRRRPSFSEETEEDSQAAQPERGQDVPQCKPRKVAGERAPI